MKDTAAGGIRATQGTFSSFHATPVKLKKVTNFAKGGN